MTSLRSTLNVGTSWCLVAVNYSFWSQTAARADVLPPQLKHAAPLAKGDVRRSAGGDFAGICYDAVGLEGIKRHGSMVGTLLEIAAPLLKIITEKMGEALSRQRELSEEQIGTVAKLLSGRLVYLLRYIRARACVLCGD
jgi:hypothetical protein